MSKVFFFIGLILLSCLPALAQPPKPAIILDDYSKSLLFSDRIQETSVVFSPDGQYLYFSREGTIFNFGSDNAADIWCSRQQGDNDNWSDPIHLGPQLNTLYPERVIAVCKDKQAIYLSREVEGKSQLLRFESTGRRWTAPQLVVVPGVEELVEIVDYSINSDERFLTICGRKADQQDLDIFYAVRDTQGKWSSLAMLELPFDQSADECSAFLASDNKSLYFATKGLSGFGGYDLYLCRKTGPSWQEWSAPQNLGANVNTAGDDLGLSMPQSGEKIAYLSSLKDGQLKLYFSLTPEGMGPEINLLKNVELDR